MTQIKDMIPPCLTEIDSTTHIDNERLELKPDTLWKEEKEEYLNVKVTLRKIILLNTWRGKIVEPKNLHLLSNNGLRQINYKRNECSLWQPSLLRLHVHSFNHSSDFEMKPKCDKAILQISCLDCVHNNAVAAAALLFQTFHWSPYNGKCKFWLELATLTQNS